MKGQKKVEIILYMVLWAILFAAPVLSMYIEKVTSNATVLDWEGLYSSWKLLSIFFIVFMFHNLFLAPLLVYSNKKRLYAVAVVTLIAVFEVYHCYLRPRPRHDDDHQPRMEMPLREPLERMETSPDMLTKTPPPPRDIPPKSRKKEPPKAFGGQDTVATVIMLLLLGLNVGTKYFFKSQDYRKRMRELERQNLRQQLEYLKYQINPHFFMNTLNNIHALVDIDPEQAKYTIEVLSKLMRYVLYEGNKPMAPLRKELAFMKNYVELMSIRYTERVRINFDIPEEVPEGNIPPLLFITFVENAFKHGISYERESFIDVSVTTDNEHITLTCRNSIQPQKESKHGGVGLENAFKRLKLIYGKHYSLSISTANEVYDVKLCLPLTIKDFNYDKMSCH